jgi:hypothetical protein
MTEASFGHPNPNLPIAGVAIEALDVAKVISAEVTPDASVQKSAAEFSGELILGQTFTKPEADHTADQAVTKEVATASHGFVELEDHTSYLRVRGGLNTNIPTELFEKREGKYGPMLALPPTVLDKLPLGDHFMSTVVDSGEVVKSTITISEENGSRFYSTLITRSSEGEDVLRATEANNPVAKEEVRLVSDTMDAQTMVFDTANNIGMASVEAKQLFAAYGYKSVKDEQGRIIITGVPTPETDLKLAVKWGVNIKHVTESNEEGEMPLLAFVKPFAGSDKDEPAYPEGVGGSLGFYDHDLRDDHKSGVLAAGQKALNMLSPIAKFGLASNDRKTLEDVGDTLDDATFIIKYALTNVSNGHITKAANDLEKFYEEAMTMAGQDYKRGAYSATVLEGFMNSGKRIGWSEQKLAEIKAAIPALAIAA